VYMNAWQRNDCMEYVVDDARQQSFIRYAVFEKNSKLVNYDLGQEDIEDRCSMAGTDLTNVAEKENQPRAFPKSGLSNARRAPPQFYSFVDRAFCQSEKVCRRGRG
jgi:hypothetical protein